MEAQDTSMSNSRLAFVGAAGMKPRNRGLSAEITLGAITDVYTPSTSSGCLGASQINPSRRSYSSSAGSPPLVEGHRVHSQPVLGVRQHAAHHLLCGFVDLVHGYFTPLAISSTWPVSCDISGTSLLQHGHSRSLSGCAGGTRPPSLESGITDDFGQPVGVPNPIGQTAA